MYFKEEEDHYGVVDKVGIKYNLKRYVLARRMEKDRHSRLKKQHDKRHKQEINLLKVQWKALSQELYTITWFNSHINFVVRCNFLHFTDEESKIYGIKTLGISISVIELIGFYLAVGEVWL